MKLREEVVLSKNKKKSMKKDSFVEEFFQKTQSLNDKRFGMIEIWTKKRGEDVLLMKKRVSNTKSNCKEDVIQAKERLKLNHDYLMKMVDFSVKIVSPSMFEVWGFYQAPLQDLKKEIQRRKSLGK